MTSETAPTPEHRSRRIPESLRLRSITPSLTVNDLDESLKFYRDVVGFTVDERWEHEGKLMGVSLVAGSTRLMLGQDDGAKGWDRKKGEGFRLYLSTAQDIDQLAADIVGRGGTLAKEPADMPWGARAFDLVDPDGFQLTVSSWG